MEGLSIWSRFYKKGKKKQNSQNDIFTALQCSRGSVLSPCLCSLRAHCEFGAAAAVCSFPTPRLTASSRPVMVPTASWERRIIPFTKNKTRLTSYSALRKVFSFVTRPERISISLLPVCLSKLKCCPLFHHPPPEVRKRKPSGEMEGLAAGQPPVRRTGMDAHIHVWVDKTTSATASL